jgi:hypothetical protein
MKLYATISFSALLLLSPPALRAQDANSVPLPDTHNTGPGSPPQPGPTPLSLIPNTPEPVEKPSHRASSGTAENDANAPSLIKKNKTQANTDDVADRIKFRMAKTKALEDEKIQALWADTEATKGDEEKRKALKNYYIALYAKILKIDGSIKKLVSQRLQDCLKQLEQRKVRPEEYPQEASAAH